MCMLPTKLLMLIPVQVEFLVGSVWRGLSAFDIGKSDCAPDKGLHRRTAGMQLARYRSDRRCAPDNLILMTDDQAGEFNSMGLQMWVLKYPNVGSFCDSMLHRVALIFGYSEEV